MSKEEEKPYSELASRDLLKFIQRLEEQIVMGEAILNSPINKDYFRHNAKAVSKMRVMLIEMRDEFFKDTNGHSAHADYLSMKIAYELISKVTDKEYKPKGATQ